MTNSDRMSRRDWFRLRSSPQTSRLGENQTPLTSVEQPVNHDGMDMSALPPVLEAMLSVEEVRALFDDIERCASDIQLMTRASGADQAKQAGYLRTACQRLLSGESSRVQVRYQWQSQRWIDTLERRDEGARLVRIGHPR